MAASPNTNCKVHNHCTKVFFHLSGCLFFFSCPCWIFFLEFFTNTKSEWRDWGTKRSAQSWSGIRVETVASRYSRHDPVSVWYFRHSSDWLIGWLMVWLFSPWSRISVTFSPLNWLIDWLIDGLIVLAMIPYQCDIFATQSIDWLIDWRSDCSRHDSVLVWHFRHLTDWLIGWLMVWLFSPWSRISVTFSPLNRLIDWLIDGLIILVMIPYQCDIFATQSTHGRHRRTS